MAVRTNEVGAGTVEKSAVLIFQQSDGFVKRGFATLPMGHLIQGQRARTFRATGRESVMPSSHRLLPFGAAGLAALWGLACSEPPRGGIGPPLQGNAPKVVWSQPSVAAVGLPAADSSRLFFLGPLHTVTAVAKHDGTILWHITLPLAVSETYGKSVLYSGGVAIVGDDDVFGLDPATGSVRWRFTPSVGRGPGRWRMAARGDTVITGSSSGDIYALNAVDGRELWRSRLPDSLMSVSFVNVEDPIIDHDLIVARYTQRLDTFPFFLGGVTAIRAAGGVLAWARALPQPFESTTRQVGAEGSAVATGIVAVSSFAGFVYGFDRATGAPRWVLPPDVAVPTYLGLPNPDARAVASDGIRIFVGSGTGWITAVQASDGHQLWRANSGLGSTRAGLWTSGSSVYATHLGGQVSSYDGTTGQVRWRLNDARATVMYGLLFDGDFLYAGDVFGPVFASSK